MANTRIYIPIVFVVQERQRRSGNQTTTTIHFPRCGAGLDAAPTELIAIFRSVAIKILLQRSILWL